MAMRYENHSSDCYLVSSTRDAVESAIESSKGDKNVRWEEFSDKGCERVSRWVIASGAPFNDEAETPATSVFA